MTCFWCKADCGMVGLCHCGCGTATKLLGMNSNNYMHKEIVVPAHTPRKFVTDHVSRTRRRFNADQVREIRRRRAEGETIRGIADDYGVVYNVVRQLLNGDSYREVV